MKRFISLVTTLIVLVFVSSCREAEEIGIITEKDQSIITSQKKAFLEVKAQNSLPKDFSALKEEKKDPPPKDKVEW